jgi:diguanylate cyclase (GGDEF)-like protein/PAS domain S-box-containing protein
VNALPEVHPTLARQLRKLGIDPETAAIDAADWSTLKERISRAYTTADQERYLLERSLALVSDEMRELHEELQAAAEARYQNLFESANDIIFTIDADGRFTSVNEACERATGFGRANLLGRSWRTVLLWDDPRVSRALSLDARTHASTRFETEIVTVSGQHIPVEINARVLQRDGVVHELVAVGRDISERRIHEAHLEYLASHDALTGLSNRRVLEQALLTATAEIDPTDASVLALLDLDNFKLINDTLGHAAGDQVLITVASLLRAHLPDALVVRLSGDEFAFLLHAPSVADALQTSERVRRGIEQADIRIGDERVFVSASIGVVPIDTTSHPGSLLAEADAAMYTAKDDGRNRLHWSNSEDALTGRLAEVYRWATEVRDALESGKMEVHYQRIVDLSHDGLGHYEALVRLRKDDELVYPSTFLPAAERFGLMPTLDRFVLDVVLTQLRRRPDVRIFVNLSATTLGDRQLLSDLLATLRTESQLGRRLGLEITETAALRDLDLAQEWMRQLQDVGCVFALDDFGTGFNSLVYVRQLPVSQLKVDGSFVRQIDSDPTQRALAAAVKALADGLGMETVAECIETADELRVVQTLGFTYGQGFLLGRPALDILDPSLQSAA